MKQLKDLRLVLSSPGCVYNAGQLVQGYVDMELLLPLKIDAIRIYAKGKCFVHWTDQTMRGPGRPRFKEVRHYSANEEYFDFVCTVLKKQDIVSSKHALQPGHYCYPFQFQLPPNLPSSFEGDHGYVRYWIKAVIEKPWTVSHVTKTAFSVISALDLNSLPDANKSAQNGSHSQLCCMCCKSGPINACLSLDRRGFVPGEPILINAEIENLSRRKLRHNSVALTMTTTFHCGFKSRSVTTMISKIQNGPVGIGETQSWHGERFYVPALPPSFLLGCSIIDVHYTLELQVDPAGPSISIRVPLEIIIGTVPLHSSIQYHARMNQYVPQQKVSRMSTTAAERVEFCNSLSVTYMESVFGSVNIKEDDDPEYTKGNLHFSPLYTFYVWNRTQTTS